TIGGKMGADDPRIEPLKLRIGDAEPLGLIAAQVVESGIGSAHQRVQHAASLWVLQVERQALLIAVERLEEMAVPIGKEMGPDRTSDVAPLGGVLNLEDFGTKVGKHHAAEGTGAVLLNRDDAQA